MKRKADALGVRPGTGIYKRPRTQSDQKMAAIARAAAKREMARTGDLKYTDNNINNTSVTSSGSFYSVLGTLTRGDNGFNNFEGNTITPRGLTCKYMFNTNQVFNQVRVLCFQWFDATTPLLSGVLQNTATNLSTLSSTSVTNRNYIKVLYDQTHVIAPTAGDGSTPIGLGICYGQFFIPAKRMRKIRFNSSSGAVQDGNIYILLVSDDIAPTYPAVNLYTRLSFYD